VNNIKGVQVNKYYSSTHVYFNYLLKELGDVLVNVIEIFGKVYSINREAMDSEASKEDSDLAKLLRDVNYNNIMTSFKAHYPHNELMVAVTLEQAKTFNTFAIDVYNKTIFELDYLKSHYLKITE
jgi:hypothetical protein